MSLMTTMPSPFPAAGHPATPLTRADLDLMPDDGRRYELIDGNLLVSPAPVPQHQRAVGAIYRLLYAACPEDLEAFFAPVDVALGPDTVLQPDLLVARRDDFSERDLPVAPLLAVEVLSPSTRRFDLMVKWSTYQDAGCAAYWVVDPDTPSLIAWELRDGAYVQVAKVTGDESATLTSPFEVTVVPANLFCR
ncbi:Uma2 family endonuclease [Kribbella albertanoniae]|uniref:Uma2 family endonuclease n=1 Tax=Kribbella albertanoniae TaxID=1266829 RepID=A0A4R4Q9H6_9ACTN|nr:Uma2 family endonuclease [Kribbella albertanoniae]TDC31927.1 Uma2 family endonuclease [Kribbella albertanoniae]